LETRLLSEAINEIGLFGNQNTVCKPVTPKWRHTVERLKALMPGYAGLGTAGDLRIDSGDAASLEVGSSVGGG
jgi:hypothetical protein